MKGGLRLMCIECVSHAEVCEDQMLQPEVSICYMVGGIIQSSELRPVRESWWCLKYHLQCMITS